MRDFGYLEPQTLQEACELLDKHCGEDGEAKILAGGVSLAVLLKNNLVAPRYLINLKTVPNLDNIEYNSGSGARIGALAKEQSVIDSPIIRERYPILAEAGLKIGYLAIRNQGTIGGNICHADPTADFPPALIALKARLKIISSKGERTIPIEKLFVDYIESSLEPTEILTEIEIPAPVPRTGWSFLELNKTSNSSAIVSVATIISLDKGGRCQQAGLALGSVGLTPINVSKIGEIVMGKEVGSNLIEEVALEAQNVCDPIFDVYGSSEYKREMVRVMTVRALNQALTRCNGK